MKHPYQRQNAVMLAYREKNTTKNQMGDFKKTKWKEVLTVSLRTNLNSVTKVGD